MIRKAFIAMLALAGITAAIVEWVGYARPVYYAIPVTDRLQGYLYTSEGLGRFYWFHSDIDIRMTPYQNKRRMRVRRANDRTICADYLHSRPGTISSYDFLWQTIPPPPGGTAPTMLFAGLRAPMATLIALLIAYPTFVIARAQYRRYRHKRGHCLKCEYDLTGNASGICPECGTPRKTDIVVVVRDGCVAGVYSSRGCEDGTALVELNAASDGKPVVRREAASLGDLPADAQEALAPDVGFKRRRGDLSSKT